MNTGTDNQLTPSSSVIPIGIAGGLECALATNSGARSTNKTKGQTVTKFTKHQLKAVVRGTISMPLEGWIRLAHLANATGCVDWQRYRDRKVGHDPATDEVICRVTGQRVADMVKEKITVGVPGLPDLTKAVIAEAGSETSPLPVGQEPKTPDFDNVEE